MSHFLPKKAAKNSFFSRTRPPQIHDKLGDLLFLSNCTVLIFYNQLQQRLDTIIHFMLDIQKPQNFWMNHLLLSLAFFGNGFMTIEDLISSLK
jgi:hypothetical protein